MAGYYEVQEKTRRLSDDGLIFSPSTLLTRRGTRWILSVCLNSLFSSGDHTATPQCKVEVSKGPSHSPPSAQLAHNVVKWSPHSESRWARAPCPQPRRGGWPGPARLGQPELPLWLDSAQALADALAVEYDWVAPEIVRSVGAGRMLERK